MGSEKQQDDLKEIWTAQEEQQRELGLAPEFLSDVEKRRVHGDLTNLLHEEVSELGRLSSVYKRHILRPSPVRLSEVALECADVLKTLLSIAQLHGVDRDALVDAFMVKTMIVSEKFKSESIELHERTKILVTDLDDVICDLSPWRAELGLKGVEASAALRLEATESMKDAFYAGGRFGDMDAILGARPVLEMFKAAGYIVVIITARPQWQYKRLHSDTVSWLRRHKIPYDLLLFNRNKVEAVHEFICPGWPAAFVEDHPDNARALAENGIEVLLYSQPHNEGLAAHPKIRRVNDWWDIARLFGVLK